MMPIAPAHHKPRRLGAGRALLGAAIVLLAVLAAYFTLFPEDGCARTYEERKTMPLCSSD